MTNNGRIDGGTRRPLVPAGRRTVDDVEVLALLDGSGIYTLTPTPADAFPDAGLEDWDEARRLDPGAFHPDGSWIMSFRCYAISRRDGRIILVDAGIGHTSSPAARWTPVPGRLLSALAEAGIDTMDVDTVVLTHLHSDHVGWSVGPDRVPTFPNARYVVQEDEIRAMVDNGHQDMLEYLAPLRSNGQLHEIDGRTRLLGGPGRTRPQAGPPSATVTAIPSPGHTPGHQSVLVQGDRKEILITGDVVVHAIQLADLDLGYVFDSDQRAARDTRHGLLSQAMRRRALLATAHLTPPFVDINAG